MYIVAIGWLWVVLMMAITESSATAGILTFVFYGLAPLALFLWLVGTPARRRHFRRVGPRENRARPEEAGRSEPEGGCSSADQAVDQQMGIVDGGDARRDQ